MSDVTIEAGNAAADYAALINAALADPGVDRVILGEGVFVLHSAIFVPSGKALVGAGRELTMLQAAPDFVRGAGGADGVVNTEMRATDVRLADFSVDANKLLPDGPRLHGCFMQQATNFSVERVDVYNATGYGHFAQGDANSFTHYASGTYEDCGSFNSQICFEQMACDGVLLRNCVAGDGDGDLIGTYFHPLAGSKNITHIDCSASGYANAGIELTSLVRPLENISFINCDIEILGDTPALVAAGSLPHLGLELTGSRFVSHGSPAALLAGVTGSADDCLFQGEGVAIMFYPAPDGSAANFVVRDSYALGLRDPAGDAAAYGVAGPNVVWDGGTIEARGAPGLMFPVGSAGVTLAGNPLLVATGFDAALSYPEHAAATAIAPHLQLSGATLAGFAGGMLTVSFRTNGSSGDQLTILNQGTAAGSIGVSDGQITYGGVFVGTASGGSGGSPLVVELASDAGGEAVQALIRAIAYANDAELPLAGARALDIALSAAGAETLHIKAAVTLNAVADVVTGDAGDNILNGGAGADRMTGGAGGDVYIVDDPGDLVVEEADQGVDLVQSWVSYALPGHVENLALAGKIAKDAIGNGLANVISGNVVANVLDGGAGADLMAGGAGNDVYFVDDPGDEVVELAHGGADTVHSSVSFILSAHVERLVLTGAAAIGGTGNGLANLLTGNAAANLLDGGAGADRMTGGAGNDIYVVDDPGDVVIELAGGGTDTVRASLSYRLGSEVENLVLTGAAPLAGTGNALANHIAGNSAANLIDGGAGADVMAGGGGDDVYVVDHGSDSVEEAAGGGHDVVRSSVSFRLAAHVEELILTGTSAIDGTGNAMDNIIRGNAAANRLEGGLGADLLDGGAGADTMAGGGGNDTYIVDNEGDSVVEQAESGFDTVRSSVTFKLGSQVEKLVLTGAEAIDGTGNWLANEITGNSAANLLDGSLGADTMAGGTGNDTYIVDNAGDSVLELAGGGVDKVRSTVTFKLGSQIEKLVLTGSEAIGGTGNWLANEIIGNSGANLLDGSRGADTMAGGRGNDTYLVDNVGDKVVESSADGGIDKVKSSVSFALGARVENLTLTGSAAVDGTGNGLANILTGNRAANELRGGQGDDQIFGGAGTDRLYGGGGNDILKGGAGDDRFYFNSSLKASNVDRILDFGRADDTIFLGRDVFKAIPEGRLPASAFRVGTQALDADDRIIHDRATGNLFYDQDGKGGAAAILFAQVDSGTILTHADFVGF